MSRKYLLPLAAAILVLSIGWLLFRPERTVVPGVRLVLLIAADQFPQSFIERYGSEFTDGLKYLLDNGVVFTEARYSHADTSTCPGHAVLATGTQPSRSGIISNSWFDRRVGEKVYCVADSEFGRSPKLLLTDTIGDWLKQQYKSARVLSASAKDRAAIILGGKAADQVFWYDKDRGGFTTSGFYAGGLPKWVRDFNDQDRLRQLFGSLWTELYPLSPERAELLQVVALDEGAFARRFPHALGRTDTSVSPEFYGELYSTPFIDQFLGEFAEHLIAFNQAGADETPDLVTLSFSALDTVGHEYGPNSREVFDTLMRLDRALGTLLRYIDNRVGLEHVLIAFSADHGIQPLPEYRHTKNQPGWRESPIDTACVQAVGKRLEQRYGVTDLFSHHLYLDRERIAQHGLSVSAIEVLVKNDLEKCPLIEKVWLASELLRTEGSPTGVERQYVNGFHPARSPDFLIQLKEHALAAPDRKTEHGSPYDYDSHVPLIMVHPSLSPRREVTAVEPLDIAPTIASFLGLEPPDEVQGRNIRDLLTAVTP
ncbi:MAG: alkaline phosphatase family protein [Bdellovibrionales bacterium]|nr:alkaline phosphatase family protein [Bdellovibrionales bacterium]